MVQDEEHLLHAFRGGAQSRPIYQERYAANDQACNHELEEVCDRLIREGGYSHNAARVARVLRVTIEDLWLDIMSMTTPYSRDEAIRTVSVYAPTLFPQRHGSLPLRSYSYFRFNRFKPRVATPSPGRSLSAI